MIRSIKKLLKGNNKKYLENKKHLSYLYNVGAPVWSEKNYDEFANEAYKKNVIAYRAINMIAQAASSVPLKLYGYQNGSKVALESHSLLRLLAKPNPMQSLKEFMQSIYVQLQLSGNVYLLNVGFGEEMGALDGNPEIYSLQPNRVQIIAGKDLIPQGYLYSVNNHSVEYKVNPITGISEVLHIKNFNPLSDWYGMSAVEAASYSIDQHNQASAWNQALLQNAARPSGAIVVKDVDGKPQHLTDEQQSVLRDSIERSFCGPENIGRPLLLQGGIEWKEMSWSPKDMDYIESKNNSAREIALAFGMPPQLLGIPGDNTYSNLAEARIALWEQTIIPMIDHVIDKMSQWFNMYVDEALELTYDLDNVTSLVSRVDAIWNRLEKNSFMTLNEKRQAAGLSDIPKDEQDKQRSFCLDKTQDREGKIK